jgi:hypothetical protein
MQYTFLICSERSGSNFITALLNGHPDISGPPPTHMFRLFGLNIEKYGNLRGEQWAAFQRDFFDARSSIFSDWNTEFSFDEFSRAVDESDGVGAAFNFMYARERDEDSATQVFIKENHTYRFLPFLKKFWPSAKFVHQVRDPRDVAASWVKTDSLPGGVEKAVEVWCEDQRATADLIEARILGDNLITIRYEDLIRSTEQELRALCEHLDVPFTSEIFDFNKDRRTLKNASTIDAWSNLSQPIMRGNAGKYRSTLSKEDVQFIELRCAGLMERYNYALTGDAAGRTSEDRENEANQLRVKLSQGNARRYDTEEEAKRRAQRQALIERVISRSQATT